LTLPTLTVIPPFDFIWRVPLAPVRDLFFEELNSTFAAQEIVPFRRIEVSIGWYPFIGDNDYARLLPKDENEQISQLMQDKKLALNPSTFKHFDTFSSNNIGFWFNYHVGRKFVSENLFRYSISKVRYSLQKQSLIGMENEAPTTFVQGDLEQREYSGSLRYNILSGQFQPFIKGGYGYSIYRVKNMTIGETPLNPSKTEWFHKPNFPWLPDTWHLGLGIEFLPIISYGENNFWPPLLLWKWKFGGPDFGLRVDYGLYWHHLGKDVPKADFVKRQQLGFTFTLSF